MTDPNTPTLSEALAAVRERAEQALQVLGKDHPAAGFRPQFTVTLALVECAAQLEWIAHWAETRGVVLDEAARSRTALANLSKALGVEP